MAKDDNVIKIDGVIDRVAANGYFKVKLENDAIIMAHVSGKIRKNFIRILPGDKVVVEMSPYDLERGRITLRY
jgi:translation initiation factor IF-1